MVSSSPWIATFCIFSLSAQRSHLSFTFIEETLETSQRRFKQTVDCHEIQSTLGFLSETPNRTTDSLKSAFRSHGGVTTEEIILPEDRQVQNVVRRIRDFVERGVRVSSGPFLYQVSRVSSRCRRAAGSCRRCAAPSVCSASSTCSSPLFSGSFTLRSASLTCHRPQSWKKTGL